jgi:hypothetical protein
LEFAVFAFAIYALVFRFTDEKTKLSLFEYIVFSGFSLFWILVKSNFLLVLAAIVLSPLILTGVCIYFCVTGGRTLGSYAINEPLVIPEAHKPTRD